MQWCQLLKVFSMNDSLVAVIWKICCQRTKDFFGTIFFRFLFSSMKTFLCFLLALFNLHCTFAEDAVSLNAVVSACEYPDKLAIISVPSGKLLDSTNCNEMYDKSEWEVEPTVMYPNADAKKTYTLINVDPDPAGYKNGQYYLHWLVSNIKGDDFTKGDLSDAKQLKEYLRPMPPAGTGSHRYMYLVFEQDDNMDLENPSGRSRFQLAPWLERQSNLRGPVAGTQFRTKF